MRFSVSLCLTFLVLTLFFTATSAFAGTVTYTDKLGRTISVSAPVKRAVLFQCYELLPALNHWDRVVGLGRWAHENDLIRAVRPDIEKAIPSVGTGTDVNMEALMKLRPDVVITWTFRPELVRSMEARGLKVIAIYPESIRDLYEVTRLNGRLFGREKEADLAVSEMERLFSLIREKTKKLPEARKKRILWIGTKPTTVAGKTGITNELIGMIGGINPAGSISQRNADVSVEQIIAWNPDLIFIWGNARYTVKDILTNPQWRAVKAVKTAQVYKAPEWSTWSPRLAPVALWMAEMTWPELFRDIDLKRELDIFYHKVFHIPPTS
ncbi:MAG: ABC transporter substrate-binding protein, partial [Nitrospirales bacterium]|nr:ABC transporter substrate-binding protein [Nitrospirales bacterium]